MSLIFNWQNKYGPTYCQDTYILREELLSKNRYCQAKRVSKVLLAFLLLFNFVQTPRLNGNDRFSEKIIDPSKKITVFR